VSKWTSGVKKEIRNINSWPYHAGWLGGEEDPTRDSNPCLNNSEWSEPQLPPLEDGGLPTMKVLKRNLRISSSFPSYIVDKFMHTYQIALATLDPSGWVLEKLLLLLQWLTQMDSLTNFSHQNQLSIYLNIFTLIDDDENLSYFLLKLWKA